MKKTILFALFCAIFLFSCNDKKNTGTIITPWGDTLSVNDTAAHRDSAFFTIDDIIANGELIMLTENGPETYYEYHGRGLGAQYLLVERFAGILGVKVRVDICKDSAEIEERLLKGAGDIAAFSSPPGNFKTMNGALKDSINRWMKVGNLLANVERQEQDILSQKSVQRKVYSPFKDVKGGVISEYDAFFKKYSQNAGWDWRLVAAQCYQESCFDPQAVSWAGAKGLMQIMPKTAEHLGMAEGDVFNPEKSIEAGCRYLGELSRAFQDIPDPFERQNFVLAAYNGGAGHIRDAMALARKAGQPDRIWNSVKEFVLLLATPEGYRDPLVKYGYMRGTETVGYVGAIRRRYEQYGGTNNYGRSYQQPSPDTKDKKLQNYNPTATPQRSTKGNKFKIGE